MPALGPSIQALAVQHLVHFAGARPRVQALRFTPSLGKGQRVRAAAFEAGPVPGRERGRFVEKEQFGIEAVPHVAAATPEIEHAANPLPRHPAPRCQRLCGGMQAPAAIAHEQAARRRGKELSERIDAVL
jgi:hypothetical protein